MMFVLKKNRHEYSGIEFLRFLLAILVIFFHLSNFEKNYWWIQVNFCVPTFMVISGFFGWKINAKRSLKIINICIIFFIYIYIISLFLLCFSSLTQNNFLLKILTFQTAQELSDWWYLFALIFVYLISPYIVKLFEMINKWYSLILIIFMIIVILGVGNIYSIHSNFDGGAGSIFIILDLTTFFFIGLWIKKYINLKNSKTILICVVLLIMFLCLGEVTSAANQNTISISGDGLVILSKFFGIGYFKNSGFFADSGAGGHGSLSTIIISSCLVILFSNIKISNKLISNIFLFLGQSATSIYALHHFIYYISINVFLINYTVYTILIYVLCAVIFCAILTLPINYSLHYLNRLTFKLLKIKQQ